MNARQNAYEELKSDKDPRFTDQVLAGVDSIVESLSSSREWTSYEGEGYGTVPRQLTDREAATVRGKIRGDYERSLVSEAALTEMERKLLNEFGEEVGAPSGLVAQDLGISTAAVTKAAKQLAARGLLEDTGYAMRFVKRTGNWQYIDRPKLEGGMHSKPGASTIWRTTRAGIAALIAAGDDRKAFRLEPDSYWG